MSAAMPLADVAVSSGLPDQKEAVRRQIPSLRNREIFAVVATGKSHEEVAQEFGLTQPRVTQIVRQVREWSVQVTGGEFGEYNEVQRLRLAEETMRVQLDGWMRMAMQEWFKSCREGIGRPTFLNTAARLSSNLAKLAGVDVSGKTARLKAEQQAKEEYELRRAQLAEKALWENAPESGEKDPAAEEVTAPTLSPDTVCAVHPESDAVPSQSAAPIKNSYGPIQPVAAAEAAQAIKERLTQATPVVSPPRADKPIPKFLDKKVRKRLLALRRQEALAAVG